MLRINKEVIYEDDNFVLLKVSELLPLGGKCSYVPTRTVKTLSFDEHTAFVEYYTKQEKMKVYEPLIPKYERGFVFYINNISPIDIPNNTIMLYTPLRLCQYRCEIESINVYCDNEVSYQVKVITSNGNEIGKCTMKEKVIDNIVS